MSAGADDHAELLKAIARASPMLMAALDAARSVGLSSWCVGAGAVRNLAWDYLHGNDPLPREEIDLVYFDAKEPPNREQDIQDHLARVHPALIWDVTNQAYVHLWYERVFGSAVQPLRSLEEGIASWPEYATCVGLTLTAHDELQVLAPYGLADLFALRVRHNPARVGHDVFAARHSSKRWVERWPQLQVVSP
ncbi:MAG: nucleotidyltransferase family protein [Steroidobacteraceae bacterium]